MGASVGMPSGAQALEAHQHTLFKRLKNEFFSRNLGQNMSKNVYFLQKICKTAIDLSKVRFYRKPILLL